MNARRIGLGAFVAIALLLLLGRWGATLYTDRLWFASLGALDVWSTRLAVVAALKIGSVLAATLFAFANLYAVRRSVISLVLPRRIANVEIGEEVPGRYLLLATLLLSLVTGLLLALPASAWTNAWLAFAGIPFGESDPYFGADLGFFVYWLPFETLVHSWAVVVLAVVTGLVVLLYALTPSLRWERGGAYVSAYVRRHLIVLGAVVLLVLAWEDRLDMYRLLSTGATGSGVFTSIDHRVLMPGLLLLAVLTMCAALVVAWAGWTGQVRLAFLAVSSVIALSLVTRTIAPLLARRGLDAAAAAAQERPHTATRLGYTRRAFGIDRIRPESLGTGFRSAADAGSRVAVWDGAMLSLTAERLRRVRPVGEGAGWIAGDSGLTAVVVERGGEAGAATRDVWGASFFDPTSAGERGAAVRAKGRLVEETLFPEPAVFDSAPAYSVLADSLREVRGVEMASMRSRLAHAWALQNFRLLFGDVPLDRPMIVRRRDVRARLAAVAPFFAQGSRVQPLVARDSLYWAVELYTVAARYPLATRFALLGGEWSYVHHAATALVHAASGAVRLVETSVPDPVASTWMSRFPALFLPAGKLDVALRTALPPVEDGARAQAMAFATAGFRGDSLEVRHFAPSDVTDSTRVAEPLHAVLPELGLAALWPLLDGQNRVRGVIAAPAGPQRQTSWIPLASDGLRWNLVHDRLRAADSTVHEAGMMRGPVHVVPVAGRAMYLQSAFRISPGGPPTLAHVAIVEGASTRLGATAAAPLGPSSGHVVTASSPQELRTRAESLHRSMREALGRGDWPAFGRAFDALGELLRPQRQ